MQVLFISIVLLQLIVYSSAKDLQINNQSYLCPNDLFSCDHYRCIPYALICNGEYNCQDKTDEINCSPSLINENFCPRNLSISCQQDILHSTRIHSESIHPIEICIHRSSVCDGIVDCRNGMDEECEEKNPLIICSINEYHCQRTNRCIPNSWKCNGINDCLDSFASDELDCPKRICLSNEFSCRTKNQCILSTGICDGYQDCEDNSDESVEHCQTIRNCTSDEFVCKSTNLCLPKSSQCDTISQCHDRSDELACQCPIEDYLSDKLFYRCSLTDQCLPKNLECDQKRLCNSEYFEDDDDQCPSFDALMPRTCLSNNTCLDEHQFCQLYPQKHCICQQGYRMNETTGICEDINECRERVICDHFCRNTRGSYQCSCQENYLLNSDKHTCILRKNSSMTNRIRLYGLMENGIYQYEINENNEVMLETKTFILITQYAYLIDHDPIENHLYFVECSVPIRTILMSCSKTRGLFRINLNQIPYEKQLILDGRDYTSIQSFAIDWLYRKIYLVNTRLQTIDICHLNGSFCVVLFHQILSDYLPQRIILYPEKGLLFYTSIVKSRAQHILRLGMDGQNLKLLFTIKITNDIENIHYLRPLLTIDRINHFLYFYNGFDQVYILNHHGEILHIQYQIKTPFHSFKIYADKIYKALNEFHINSKYSLGTIQFDPIVQIISHENFLSLNSFHQPYSRQYSIDFLDFLFIDSNQRQQRDYPCEQFTFPNVRNQTELICACTQYYTLANDGYSCISNCPQHFFHCSLSKKCIPFHQQCNGILDCQYGEDESHCSNIICNQLVSFHCLNQSKCLKKEDLCNNVTDCLDGEDEDELICQHFCQWPSLNTCTKKYPNLCSETEFYCDGKCVSITHRCDEQPFCYDGADQPFNCLNMTCPTNYFKCPMSGKCIPNEKVCDNFDDCLFIDKINGIIADETLQSCNYILTQSSNSATIPPPISITCESADLFRCKTSQFCINRTYVCDGDFDCFDSSDEENCETFLSHTDHTCMNGYHCSQQRHELNDIHSLCIPLNELCDGIHQCPLGDDEHQWRCQNCTYCEPMSSFCEIINRIPTCQCRKGYIKIANGSCILADSLCNWSYDHCSHVKISRKEINHEFCIKKSSYVNCQCDYGYEMIENTDQTISCRVQTNQTLDLMLNPRASFYLYHNRSLFAPINPSHHAIDVIFIPYKTAWLIFYTEQRNGHAFIWQQTFNFTTDYHNDAIQIWSSSIFQFSSIKIDWIHRLIYILYTDPTSSSNGIEILYSNQTDYKYFKFLNRLTFSNKKTISSIQIHPLQGYLYISAYYDAQHSFVYRSLLDGSNLEVYLTLNYPILSMTIDYRHPRLYVLLSNGEIDSYSLDISQPWKINIYKFQNVDHRPYMIDLYDDYLNVMIFNSNESIYDEILLNKFGKFIEEKQRHFKTSMIIRYVHEYKYPQIGKSEMINQVCSDSLCSNDRICITTPINRPLCITPGQMNLCGSSCISRGICSNGECLCSNRSYTGDNCEICRVNDNINVGCFHLRTDPSYTFCMCYLSKSRIRYTPYICTTLKNGHGEIEIPCDRFVSPVREDDCKRKIFSEPYCDTKSYSLIYDIQTKTCICREMNERKMNCFNNGMMIIDENRNLSTCLCTFPYYGNRCELSQCKTYCRNNGTCSTNGKTLFCSCSYGFTGQRCETNLCQSIICPTNQTCLIEDNKPICHCSNNQMCRNQKVFPWHSWFLTIILCLILSFVVYLSVQYTRKYIRLKYLFSHHRLQEQIDLEINSTNSHLSSTHDDRILENNSNPIEDEEEEEEDVDDPFYIDEKQPIFSHERSSNRSVHTGI